MNNIEITLPNNKNTLEFIKLSQKDKNKVLELGLLFLNNGYNKLQYWNNEETENIINNIKKNNEKISKLKAKELDEFIQHTKIIIFYLKIKYENNSKQLQKFVHYNNN